MHNGYKNLDKKILTIPNYITTFHIILLIPLFFLLKEGYWFKAGLLFLFTGVLDLLDGYLARKRKEESNLGKVLDVLADKCGSILVLFFIQMEITNQIYLIIFRILIFIEIALIFTSLILMALSLIKKTENIPINVTRIGKISMFALFLIINAWIFSFCFKSSSNITTINNILIYFTGIIALTRIITLIKYFIEGTKLKFLNHKQ